MALELDANEIVGRGRQGRDAWLREGKRQLEQHRWENPDPISRSRGERLLLSAERLGSDLDVERRANEAYEHYRATARDRLGRRPGGRAEPFRPPEVPAGKVNVTDPDSRPIPIGFGFVQGYNAQAAVNEQQIVLAAEITNSSTDFSQLDPMVTATLGELERAGIEQLPEAVAADAGYWNEQHMDEVVANKHIPVLVAPDKGTRGTPKRWLNSGRAAWMRSVLAAEHGQQRYRKRKQTVEPLVRQHQTQQRLLPLPQARQDQGAPRVAITDDDPQPDQGSPPSTRDRGGLNGPPRRHTAAHGGRAPNDRPPAVNGRAIARAFERQPRRGPAVITRGRAPSRRAIALASAGLRALSRVPHCDSDDSRAPSDRELVRRRRRAYAPGMRRVGTSGASVARPDRACRAPDHARPLITNRERGERAGGGAVERATLIATRARPYATTSRRHRALRSW